MGAMRRPAALGTGWLCCLALTACSPSSPAGSTPTPSAAPERTVAVFLGDSYTAGWGAAKGEGYVGPVAAELGWLGIPAGESGTGYVDDSDRVGQTVYAGRVEDVPSLEPDVVVVQGSTNDVGEPAGAVRAAAGELYAQLAAQVPDARIVVVGPAAPPSVDPVGVRDVRNELQQAASDAGLPFVDPIAEGWLRPADGLFADDLHPNATGYARLAQALVVDLHRLGW